jgi:predicted nucleic acid-binding protein
VIVVSDTGPLISLAVIDRLDLLEKIFDKIVIPKAVWLELCDQIDTFDIPQVMQLQTSVVSLKQNKTFSEGIDFGETEAILLYEEIHADQLLIDDKFARKKAESRKVHCLGTLAVLVKAKEQNFISELKPLFMQLLARKRYYSIALLDTVLSACGEVPFSPSEKL